MEIPIKIYKHGDLNACNALIPIGLGHMKAMEKAMELNALKQYELNMVPFPGALITCKKIFSLREITIRTNVKGGGLKKGQYIECFANSTCALAYVLEVVGVTAVSENDPHIDEIICQTCITPNTYPAAYYCSKQIKYNLAVCALTDGKYVLMNDVESTDFTPRCPGDQVIVMLNRTINTDQALLDAAMTPLAKKPFTRLIPDGSFISILPFYIGMPKNEIKSNT